MLTIKDALVDTGATMLSVLIDLIEKLGLKEEGIRQVRTANGTVDRRYRVIRISLEGREGLFQIMGLPIKMPVLIGQIVLEQLDLYPDPQHNRLVGRQDSPNNIVIECYRIEGEKNECRKSSFERGKEALSKNLRRV